MRFILTTLWLTFLMVGTAHAQEALPQGALDKDYQNCMGGENEHSDPQRAQYCHCVMDEVKKWDTQTYGSVATEQSKSPQAPAAQLENIAKACIDKILK
jgi:hypothetical protein